MYLIVCSGPEASSVDSPPLSQLRQQGLMVPITGQVAQSGRGLPWGHTPSRELKMGPRAAHFSLCSRLRPPLPVAGVRVAVIQGQGVPGLGRRPHRACRLMQRSSPDG